MSEKPIAILKNRFYVPLDSVTDEDLDAFTYQLKDYSSQDLLTVKTYKKFTGYYGFARGDLGKIQKVFGDRFEIQDERAIVPHGYPLRFTGKLRDEQEKVWKQWLVEKYGLVKAPPRWGKCLVGSSLVATGRGLVPLKRLVAEQTPGAYPKEFKVATLGGMATTSHVHHKAVQPTRLLTSRSGFSVQGTAEHPVLTYCPKTREVAWLPLDSVSPDDHWVGIAKGQNIFSGLSPRLPQTLGVKSEERMSEQLASLMGYLASSWAQRTINKFPVEWRDPKVTEEASLAINSYFGVLPNEFLQQLTAEQSAGSPFGTFLASLGLPCSVDGAAQVPWSILQSPRDLVVAFLKAYFACEISQVSNHLELVSSNLEFVTQLQILLAQLGLMTERYPDTSADPVRTLHRLVFPVTTIDDFNFIFKTKYVLDTKYEVDMWFSSVPGLNGQLPGIINSNPKLSRLAGKSIYGIELKDITELDPELGARLALAADPNIHWDPISCVEAADSEDVYDLTVPYTNCFVANGMYVHNTIFMTHAMVKLRQRTLVLAHESGILQQFEDTVRKFTNINELEKEHGVKLCGQLRKYEDVYPIVTFSTWQMLNQPGAELALKQNRNAFGMVFVDEAHACAAPCFSKIVSNFNPYYRMPVTATETRKDGFDVVVSDVAGPLKVVGSTQQLPVLVTVVWTKYEVKHFADWNGLWNQLCRDDARNTLIAKMVVQDVAEGHSCVVFTDRRQHASVLKQKILEANPDLAHEIDILIGGSPKTSIRDRARSGDLKVVIASPKIVQLGWDIPRWSALHNTLPMANEQNWEQRISRIRTPCPSCPGVGSGGCLNRSTCQKLPPVARIYADLGSKVTYSCLAVMNRVHKRLNFEVQNIKQQKKPSTATTRAKTWDQIT